MKKLLLLFVLSFGLLAQARRLNKGQEYPEYVSRPKQTEIAQTEENSSMQAQHAEQTRQAERKSMETKRALTGYVLKGMGAFSFGLVSGKLAANHMKHIDLTHSEAADRIMAREEKSLSAVCSVLINALIVSVISNPNLKTWNDPMSGEQAAEIMGLWVVSTIGSVISMSKCL